MNSKYQYANYNIAFTVIATSGIAFLIESNAFFSLVFMQNR